MRVGVIIPSRGDRPQLLDNCLRMLKNQTVQPEIIELVNHLPESKECDITKRYREGYDRLRNKAIDVIALMEDDDYYSPQYLESMLGVWEKKKRPDLLGTDYTIYYHIKLFSYFIMHHMERASAMNTLIKPDLNFEWCPDNEPYTDLHLWDLVSKGKLNGVVFHPTKHYSIGIKHGVGMCGGRSHTDRLHRYQGNHSTQDYSKDFLREHMDAESFNFYSNYFKNEAK
ncbi:MAG: hypothetical protein K0S44_208 [Bacteroidetes bacterium]|jgi:glycosyltransferase involved in cell wall biosynthesis|nr:hypothetical protein [Bacteroidota bacterium]